MKRDRKTGLFFLCLTIERRNMNRIRKVLPAVVIAAGILVSVTGMAFAAYHISGTLGLGLPLIGGSTNNVRCDGQLTASSYLLNTGENVTLNLKDGGNPGDFVGRSSSHNRIAKYSYEGIFRYLIHTPNGDYISDKAVLSFNEPGDYKVTGYITFRWETDSGKVAAGFAKYYYRTFEVSCIIRVTDLEDAAEPEQPPSNGNQGSGNDGEEKIVPELSGEVSHTAEWEKHRQDFNRRCKELGKEQWYRNQNTYFSGENLYCRQRQWAKIRPHR